MEARQAAKKREQKAARRQREDQQRRQREQEQREQEEQQRFAALSDREKVRPDFFLTALRGQFLPQGMGVPSPVAGPELSSSFL